MNNSELIWDKYQERYDRWFPLIWLILFILAGLSIWQTTRPTPVQSTVQTDIVFTPIPLNTIDPNQPAGPVNLRTAAAAELESLNGIGPKKAAAIIEARNSGRLNSVPELEKVKGIGPKQYSEFKDQVIWE